MSNVHCTQIQKKNCLQHKQHLTVAAILLHVDNKNVFYIEIRRKILYCKKQLITFFCMLALHVFIQF